MNWRRWLGRALCRLNQHVLVTESEQWSRPDLVFVAANLGGGDLQAAAERGDTDGVIQTRCARGCGLIFPWSFIVREDYDRRAAGRDTIALLRELASGYIGGPRRVTQ